MVSRGLIIVLLLGLSACTAQGARFAPSDIAAANNAGTIYVYRPLGTIGTRGESPFVSIGGKSYGTMKAGSFVAASVPVGEVKVTVQQSLFMLMPTIPRSVMVTVVPGSVSYVRVNQTIDSADASHGLTVMQSVQIEEVAPEVGQAELGQTRQN